MIEKVEHFNRTVVGVPERKPNMLDSEEFGFVIGALREELNELEDAYKYGDFIGCIDSLLDNIYFAIGGLVRMGLPADMINQMFTAVHNCNMNKVNGVKEEREVNHELDAVKPEGWVSPEERIADILDNY